MAKTFKEIKKSNPYPRQKGGRFGFATGKTAKEELESGITSSSSSDAEEFDPFKVLMGEAERYQKLTPEQRETERKTKAEEMRIFEERRRRREEKRRKEEQQRLDASTDFESVPDSFKAPGISNDGEITKCKSIGELRAYMKSGYDVELYDTLDELNFEAVRDSVNGTVSVLRDFPSIQESRSTQLFGIGVMPEFKRKGAACYETANISLNPEVAETYKKPNSVYVEQANRKWWVENASPKTIGAHEAGHHMAAVLTELNPDIPSYRKKSSLRNHQEAQNVVRTAIRNYQKTKEGKGKTESSLREEISGQSSISYGETMAEAYSDCVTNGTKAHPLSQEIRRVATHRVRRFMKGRNDG